MSTLNIVQTKKWKKQATGIRRNV